MNNKERGVEPKGKVTSSESEVDNNVGSEQQ